MYLLYQPIIAGPYALADGTATTVMNGSMMFTTDQMQPLTCWGYCKAAGYNHIVLNNLV